MSLPTIACGPRVIAVLLLASVLAGCDSAGISSSPPVATSGATEAATEPATTAEQPLATALPSGQTSGPAVADVTQTDTAWGRIWDALPRSFPRYPGSELSTEVGEPASGQLVVPTDVDTATVWLKAALDATGLRTTVSGPLEDGSMRLDSVGANGCAVQTTIARTGTVTLETVLYGATCPFS